MTPHTGPDNRLRVLHVINSLRKGGAERLCINICNELVERGVSAAIFLLEDENEYAYLLDPRVEIIVGDTTVALSVVGRDRIDNRSYIRFVERFRPDIVHSHLPWSDILVSSHPVPGARYYSHLHSSHIPELARLDWRRISKKALALQYERRWLRKHYQRLDTTFIACSRGAESFGEKHIDLRGNRMVLLRNATTIPDVAPTDVPGISRLLNVATLAPIKNQALLVDVVHELRQRFPTLQMWILGDGPCRRALAERIEALELEDAVFLEGGVSNVEEYMEHSHLYVHSSKPRTEGLPMVFIEALGHHLPVITTDCTGEDDIIVDGDNGFVVEADVSAFASRIGELIEDAEAYGRMRARAGQSAKSYDIRDYASRLLDLYRQ